MPEMLKIIILSLVQGFTEFLPVSSSGHLAILGRLMDVDPDGMVMFTVVVHIGTLAAVTIFYFPVLLKFLNSFDDIKRIMFYWIVVNIPAGIVGVVLKKSGFADGLFSSVIFSAIGLFISAAVLLSLKLRKNPVNNITLKEIPFMKAVKVGLAQAVAVLPGVSRSGMTVATGLWQGIKEEDAAAFSFIIAMPLIAGAGFLEFLEPGKTSCGIAALFVAFLVSFASGCLALKLLVIALKKRGLPFFGYYCLFVGTLTLILNFCGYLN